MNSCFKVKNLLSAYLDRELSGEEMLLIRDHVGGCPDCELEFQEIRRVKSLLLQLPAVEPADDLFDRVKASVFAGDTPVLQGSGGQGRKSSFATLGMAAAMLVLGLAVMRWVEVQRETAMVAGSGQEFSQGADSVVYRDSASIPTNQMMIVSAPE